MQSRKATFVEHQDSNPEHEIQKVRLDLETGGVLSKDRNTLLIHCYNVDDLHSVSPVYMGEELRVQTPFHPPMAAKFPKDDFLNIQARNLIISNSF